MHLRISRKLGNLNLVFHLEAGKQADLVRSVTAPLAVAVPVVPRNADCIARQQADLARLLCFVWQHRDPIVRALAPVVVNVVQRLELVRSVREIVLHYLVRYPAHLQFTG